MTLRSFSCWTALALLLPGPALAAQATPEEAQRLTDLFQRYVGKPAAAGKPSAVKVTPQGTSYKVDFDLAALAAPFAPMGLSVANAGPLTMVLTPQDDSLWHVTADGLPSVALIMGKQTSTLKYDGYAFDGLFDPKLQSFTKATSKMTGASTDVVGADTSSTAHYTGQMSSVQTGADAGDGSVDFTLQQSVANLDYTQHMTELSAAVPTTFDIKASAASIMGDSKVSHLSTAALFDLWAFLVAHSSEHDIKARQDELKAKFDAFLAPDPSATMAATARTFVIDTPMGRVALADFAQNLEIGGEKAGAHVSLGLKGSGLSVPSDKIPAWAGGLVPNAFDLSLNLAPVHLNQGLRKAVADMNVKSDPPLNDVQKQEVIAAFGDPSSIVLTLNPTTVSSSLVTIKASGSARLGPGNMPVGTGTVTATGLDKALEALNASSATDPDAQQAVAFLTGMKQLAKAEAKDTYSWAIDAQPGKPVTVNGAPLAAAPPADSGNDNDNDNDNDGDQEPDSKTP